MMEVTSIFRCDSTVMDRGMYPRNARVMLKTIEKNYRFIQHGVTSHRKK